MWKNRNEKQRIEKREALDHINEEMTEYGNPKMDEKEFDKIVADLKKMQCIEIDGEEIWLKKWVKSTY